MTHASDNDNLVIKTKILVMNLYGQNDHAFISFWLTEAGLTNEHI